MLRIRCAHRGNSSIVSEALGDTYQQHLEQGTTLSLLDANALAITTIDQLQGNQPVTG